MRNQEISRLLNRIADLLELRGESLYRVVAYREAAKRIENLTEDIGEIAERSDLQEIPGVGSSIASKIEEYLKTGHSSYYEELKREFPEELVRLMEIPGLGPRKVQLVYRTLNITTPEELERAAREHKLRNLPGMGAKTEENILKELARWRQRTQRLPLGVAWPAAEKVAELMRRCPTVYRVEPAGSIRRRKETIGDIDLIAGSDDPAAVMDYFTSLPVVADVIAKGPTKSSILTKDNLQIDLRVVQVDSFGAALQYFTGSKAHNIHIRDIALKRGLKVNEYGVFEEASGHKIGGRKEEDIYRALGMPIMPPEIREDEGEIEAALAGRLPKLVELEDIKADLHDHTNWSDGLSTLEEMAEAARARGYQYLAITDHSMGLGVAGGMSVERLLEQRWQIRELNKRLKGIRLLAGIEVNIMADGSLDYDDDILRGFDVVVASVHSGFSQSRKKMTERIIRAMQNPWVDIIAHPTGRLIGKRDPYEVDLEAVCRAAVETGTALEVNGAPDRLDLDGFWARRAKEMGAKLVVVTDAHHTSTMNYMRFGVATARRGWLEAKDVLNTLTVEDFLASLSRARYLMRKKAG